GQAPPLNMAHEHANAELLSAYLDGELTADEQARVEQWLADDPAARGLLDELRALSGLVRQLPAESLGEDLAPIVLRQAERETLLGRAAGDGQPTPGATPTQPATRSDKPRWWGHARRLFNARGLGWAVAAVAVAVLITFVSPQLTRREIARGPVEQSADEPDEAHKADKAERAEEEEIEDIRWPEGVERPSKTWKKDVEVRDEANEKPDEADERAKTGDNKKEAKQPPQFADELGFAEDGTHDAAPGGAFAGKGGGGRGVAPPESREEPPAFRAKAPDRPRRSAPDDAPPPPPARKGGLTAKSGLRRPAGHEELNVPEPQAEEPSAPAAIPPAETHKKAPSAQPDVGGEKRKQIAVEGRRLRSAGRQPPTLVRVDVTPAAARAGAVRGVLTKHGLLDRRSREAVDLEQQRDVTRDREVAEILEEHRNRRGGQAADGARPDPQSGPHPSPLPKGEGAGVNAGLGAAEIISLQATPAQVAAAVQQFKAMSEQVLAVSVEPVPGERPQDEKLRQPASVAQQVAPAGPPEQDAETESAEASQAGQGEPAPILLIVRVVADVDQQPEASVKPAQ
ncbi:MAG: anti-sigma factor family protein, partial [Pirellulales bacterium]